jgi:hypothetical protein
MTWVKDHMRESLKGHRLAIIADVPGVKAYAMKRPGTRTMSVNIIECGGRLAVHGDLCIGTPNGCISAGGYGIRWFRQRLSESYLCEKFLTTAWHWEICEPRLHEIAGDEHEDDPIRQAARELLNNYIWSCGEPCSADVYYELTEAGWDPGDGVPGHGYDRADAGWLCAINQRFAELFDKPTEIYPSIEALDASRQPADV